MGIFSLFFVQREGRTNLALHLRSSAEPTQGRRRARGRRSKGQQVPAQRTNKGGRKISVCARAVYKRGCAGRRGVVVSVLRPQPDAGGAGAAFEPSVGSGSLREGKAGSGGLLTEKNDEI